MKINILYFFLFFGYFLNAKFTDFYYEAKPKTNSTLA